MDFCLDECRCSDEEIRELTVKWKDRLGLVLWDIEVFVQPSHDDMPLPDTQGVSEACPSIRHAKITLLNAEEFNGLGKLNMHQTLIHELLHVKFSLLTQKFKPNSIEMLVVEQEIDNLATLLYKMEKMLNDKESNKGGKNST